MSQGPELPPVALPPLPDAIDALLQHERQAPPPPAAQLARLDARVLASTGAAVSTPSSTSPESAPRSEGPMGELSSAPFASAQAGKVIAFLATFMAGTVFGAGVVWTATLPSAPSMAKGGAMDPVATDASPEVLEVQAHLPNVPVDETGHVAPTPGALPISVQASGPSGEAAMDDSAQDPPPDSARDSSPDSTRDPEEEVATGRDLVLLERARVALSRGRPRRALRALREHLRRYPAQSQEDREALWIQGLVASGQEAQARQLAVRFRVRYPRSLYRHVLDAALRAASPTESSAEEENAPSPQMP